MFILDEGGRIAFGERRREAGRAKASQDGKVS